MQSNTPTPPFGRRSLTFAHVASQIAASTRPPEKLAHNKPLRRNGAGAEIGLAFTFDLPPLVVRSEESEIQSLAASRRYGGTNLSRPHTCSRNAAPTVAVAHTHRRKMTDQQPNP
jgi:hypothetical protein